MNSTFDSSASAGSTEQSCAAVATFLVDHYGLAPPVDVRELEAGANRNFVITSQDQRYVCRIYTDHDFYVRNPEAYRYELDLLAYLINHKLAVPEPVKRLDGQRLSVLDAESGRPAPWRDGACSALFRFFEGEEHVTWYPEVKEPVVTSFGAAVAEIHQRADQFPKPYCRHHFDLQYLLDGPLQTLESILKERRGEDLAFFKDYADHMRRQISGLGKGKDIYGLIHADLHVGNILYHPDNGYCILDFDQCAFGWRSYDVATFKYNIIETVPDHLTDEIWRCFLEGYNQVRPLTQQELDCLPVFANAWTLWDIGETLVLATQWGGHRPDLVEGDLSQDEYLDEAVETLRGMV
ncbi:MAG: phosphotransferase [Gemmatimonadetes bacterium]|nr:phosphotransferase [Gemmatimonadota bacterium]MYD24994.1 phosphotransferase [Gemmatimonadota bacterium]MYI99248.1 phosphotransferase [Gemmatimonadota bacterium]